MEMRQSSAPEAPVVALRPVGPEDDDFLLEVYASTRADEMALVDWTEAQKHAFLESQSRLQRLDYERNYPDAEYSVILVEGRPAGRLWVARTAEQIRLIDIALLPAFQRRGVGTRLVRGLIDESERAGLPLRHMVYHFNAQAMRFYERLGFARGELFGAYWLMERRPGAASAAAGSAPKP